MRIPPVVRRGPLSIALVIAGGAALAVGTIVGARPKPARDALVGMLVPAYGGPDALARPATGSARGRVAIVNPDNGPGNAAQPAYRKEIAALRRAGGGVVGYVHTDYGRRDRAAVLADMRRYRSWYGVRGVFLDEVSDTEQMLPYYRSIAASLRGSGERVILNPGVVPAPAYFDIADTVVTFEGPVSDYAGAVRATPRWLRELPRSRVAHLVYAADEEEAMKAAGLCAAGLFFATSGTLPDPWSAPPPYLDRLQGRLGGCP